MIISPISHPMYWCVYIYRYTYITLLYIYIHTTLYIYNMYIHYSVYIYMLHLDVYDFKTKPPILGGWRFLSHTHCSWGVEPSNERVHFDPHLTCGITFHMQVPTMISQGPTIHGHILQVSKNGVPMIDQDVKMLFLLNSEKDQSSAWAMRPLPRFLGTSSDSGPSSRTG